MEGEELIYALEEKLDEIDRDNNFYEYICTLVKLKEEKKKRIEFLNEEKKDIKYSESKALTTKNVGFFQRIINFFKNLFKQKKQVDTEEEKILNNYSKVLEEENSTSILRDKKTDRG